MRKVIIIFIALYLCNPVQAQEPQQRETWNEIFTKREGREFPHNKFLAETIRGRQPGAALDIGIGEGRNALFLASRDGRLLGSISQTSVCGCAGGGSKAKFETHDLGR